MVPPSAMASGGSSEMASRIRLVTSVAGADGAAIGDGQRRLIGDGFQNQVGDVGQFVEPFVNRAQPQSLLRIEAAFERRNLFERAAERQQVARASASSFPAILYQI